jgi:hypothetical protein
MTESITAPMSSWKMIYLAKRNPTLAATEFAQAWRDHSALGKQCRNVQDKVLGVKQCTSVLSLGLATSLSGIHTDADGVNLLQIRDLQVASDIWHDPETQAIMKPDELRVFDRYVRDFTLVAEEKVLVDRAAGQAVLVGFLKQVPKGHESNLRQALSDFSNWNDGQRLVLNWVQEGQPEGYEYDAIVEWWFEDAQQLLARLSPTAVQIQLQNALGHLCQLQTSVFMATQVTHQRP